MHPTLIVAYLVIFATVGFLFIFAALLIGWFLRAREPTPQKQAIYECGEPPVGTGFVQFDLRFYVVALVFIIFDVEVAFFFPWATVFGKAAQLTDRNLAVVVPAGSDGAPPELAPAAAGRLRELGVPQPEVPVPSMGAEANAERIRQAARKLAMTAMADIGVFFGVLLVGFAYVWYRRDLDWVRAYAPRPTGGRREPAEETMAVGA